MVKIKNIETLVTRRLVRPKWSRLAVYAIFYWPQFRLLCLFLVTFSTAALCDGWVGFWDWGTANLHVQKKTGNDFYNSLNLKRISCSVFAYDIYLVFL